MKIKKLDEGNVGQLYHQYHGQTNPQKAFIEIDLDEGIMQADWDGEIGGAVPMRVWHGRVRRYDLPPYCLPGPVNELMEEILPLAERMEKGYSCEWDGSNNVGKLDEDAQETEEAIRDMVENYQPSSDEMLVVMDACEYYSDSAEHLTLLRDSGERALRESLSRDFYCPNAGLPVHLENIDEYVEFLQETLSESEED